VNKADEIYRYGKILTKLLTNIEKDPYNSEILKKYYQSRVAEGLSQARIIKCLSTLRLISLSVSKSFSALTKDEIVKFIADVEQRNVSAWTKHDYKIIFKIFYKWLRGTENYPPEVKWIKVSSNIPNNLQKKDLLTVEEIQRIVDCATNLRDRAFIWVLFESMRRLGEDSLLVTPKQRMKPFIRSTNVGDVIRDGIRKAGFPWRPHVLRSYFDTEIMLAESKGLVLRDYRQFWMGHKGDIEHRYTLNKGRLPGEVVEDLREAYRRSQEYLQTGRSESDSEERLRDSFRKQLLAVAGLKPEEIEGMDLSMEDTEFQELVRRRLLGSVSGRGQKVVSVGEVERYLSEGWGFVSTLPRAHAQ
jgi:hypothetical protein